MGTAKGCGGEHRTRRERNPTGKDREDRIPEGTERDRSPRGGVVGRGSRCHCCGAVPVAMAAQRWVPASPELRAEALGTEPTVRGNSAAWEGWEGTMVGVVGGGQKRKKKKKESSGKIPVLGPWQRCPDPPRPMDYCTKKCYFCFNNLLRRWNSNAGFVLSSEGALFLRRPRSGRGLRGRPHPPLPEVSPRPGRVSPPPHVPQPRRRRSPRALPAAPGGPHPRSPPRSRSPGRGVGGGRAVLTPRGERGWGRTERRGASGRRSAPGDALTRILPIETGTGTSSPSRRPSVGDGDRAIRCRGVSSRGSGMAEPGAAGGHGGRELRFAVPGRGGTVGAAPWEGAGPPRRSGSRRRGAVNGRKAAAGPPGPGATSPSRVNGRFPSWRRPGPARPLRAPVRARGGGGEGENAPGRG